jgi:hypothetical protein
LLKAILGGGISGKTRLLQPIQLVSGIFAVIGAALLYNLDVNSSKAWYIGAQIPLGFGIGFGNQVSIETFTHLFSRYKKSCSNQLLGSHNGTSELY